MSILRIRGGRPLSGTIRVQGAKNSILPILAATLLSGGVCRIRNCPRLSDVEDTLKILEHLGCRAAWEDGEAYVDATCCERWDVPDALMGRMRSSVIFLGPILGRMGRSELTYPGGCELGPRPIDLHLLALEALGVRTWEEEGRLFCQGKLAGAEVALPFPSVGCTENAMLAAVAAQGITTIRNAAREPEIEDLQEFLNTLGAHVRGAGSSTLVIRGGRKLHGGEYTVMGDRIVAATYLSAVTAAGGEGELLGVEGAHLSTVIEALSRAGSEIWQREGSVYIKAPGRPGSAGEICTAPYPGFPTDAQAVVMASLCRGEGTTEITERIFVSRYRHVPELVHMGADIRVEGDRALVRGVPRLSGCALTARELRGGAALAVAALAAEGESVLSGVHYIDRGYGDLAGDLRALGADIRREE